MVRTPGDGVHLPRGDFYINAVNRVGRRYARHVLGALGEEVITRQDAAAALDVREHHLSRLAQQL